MTRAEWLADRTDLLRETDAIARDLQRIEQQYGFIADAERRRLQQLRDLVSAQVQALLSDNGVLH